MKQIFAITVLLFLVVGTTPAQKSGEWAKGIKFHTKWDDAIKEVRATGKLLFIYNGWQNRKV